jgi:hypothetical protein
LRLRCARHPGAAFLGAIAVLALAIHLFAMAASSGSSAQAIADALLIDAGTSVAFGSVPGAVSGAMDVGTTPIALPPLQPTWRGPPSADCGEHVLVGCAGTLPVF